MIQGVGLLAFRVSGLQFSVMFRAQSGRLVVWVES